MSIYLHVVGLGHGEHYEDNSLDVFQYFNTNCFSGYNDEEKV
jgi:DnaJ family protein A protein 5